MKTKKAICRSDIAFVIYDYQRLNVANRVIQLSERATKCLTRGAFATMHSPKRSLRYHLRNSCLPDNQATQIIQTVVKWQPPATTPGLLSQPEQPGLLTWLMLHFTLPITWDFLVAPLLGAPRSSLSRTQPFSWDWPRHCKKTFINIWVTEKEYN